MPNRIAVMQRLGLGRRRARTGIAARMTRTFVLIAGTLILLIGLVLTWASYAAVLEQVQVRQQKTAREAALVTTAYLRRARDTLSTYGQLGGLQGLLLRSMRIQQEELSQLLIEHAGMFRALTLVDGNGNELAKVLASVPVGANTSPTEDQPLTVSLVPVTALGSVANSVAFQRAIAGETYVSDHVIEAQAGRVPAVTFAVPLRGRDRDGVLIAEVSVDGLWDEMRAVDLGTTGYAYIVSRDTGELITVQSVVPPAADDVQAAESSASGVLLIERLVTGDAHEDGLSLDVAASTDDATSTVDRYVGLMGEEVVGAAAALPGTTWILLAELPVSEALASANRVLYLLVLLVVVGAVGAGSVGLLVPRRVVRPILALREGAKEISEGRLSHSIEVKTGDELQDLADTFNQMASSLEASRDELEEWGRELEVRVSERTIELATMTDQMRRRADQLQISAEVAHTIASVRDLDTLLPHVTRLIGDRFGWYHVGIFLLEAAMRPGATGGSTLAGRRSEYAILRAANSDGGQRMLAAGHKLRVAHAANSDREQLLSEYGPGQSRNPFGIVGSVAGTGTPRIALDVGADAVYFDNPHLPDTRSEMALPLKVGDRVIGVLDVQSTRPQAYDEQDVALLGVLADQVAVAIENALLFEQTQEALEEVRTLHRRYVEQAWVRSAAAQGELAYEYRRGAGKSVVVDDGRPELQTALAANRVVVDRADREDASGESHDASAAPEKQDAAPSELAVPIKFRDQVIGVVDLQDTDEPRWWTEDEIVLVQAIADQVGLALENARLFADTQQRAEQLATLHRVGLDVTAALDLDGVLAALYQQINPIMDVRSFYVALYDEMTGVIDFPFMMGDEGRVEAPPRRIGKEPGITHEILETGRPLHVPDLLHRAGTLDTKQLDHFAGIGRRRTRSYIGVPLVFRDHVFGVLSVQSDRPNAYSQDDVDLLTTIATQASIAIQNARAYQQLVETAEELREIDRLKTQFLANMSHELRTPLNSIIGFSRVMLKGIDGPLTDMQEADLNSIYGSGQHLLGLINSILDMSKIEAGKMDLSFDEVSLHEVFNTVIGTTRALVKDQPIELRTEIPDTLPTVWADSQRVRQVLLNLVSNASKFTDKGYIKLKAEVGTGEAAGFVTISVQDTGIGIGQEAQERLFIPFQQVDASTTRRAGGTGLGLAISRSFVEMQGGKIWVESVPGQGTAFFFTLPVYVPEVRSRVPEDLSHEQEPATEDRVFSAPRTTILPAAEAVRPELAPRPHAVEPERNVILVVDDDSGVVTLFKRYLEMEGYRVLGLSESLRAVDVARQMAPHIVAITLDIVMPRMDGWQVLTALKSDPVARDVPVILCSILDNIEHGVTLGADGWLHKPVTRDEILAAVRKVQVARASRRSASAARPAAPPGTGPAATLNVGTASSDTGFSSRQKR